MGDKFFLNFETMPTGTAQQKGECIRYRIVNGKRVPYIHHFKAEKISSARQEFEWKLKSHLPEKASEAPIRLMVVFYFDIKQPKKIWGTYKTTKPDVDNFVKELIDAMSEDEKNHKRGFWKNDSQIVDLHIIKYYAEKATIYIEWDEVQSDAKPK